MKYVFATALVLGGTGYFSGWIIDLYFKTGWLPIIPAIICAAFGILLHGIPNEEEKDGS